VLQDSAVPEDVVREPDQIRQDCAAKLRRASTSGMFTAILGCLVGEDWTTPKIVEMHLTSDRCLLARSEGDIGFNHFIGAEDDLIRNIHGVAKTVGLDGDELGYLLGAVAKLKRLE